MKKWWRTYFAQNRNIIAFSFTILAAVIIFGIIFHNPVSTMLDNGQYDVILPECGLDYIRSQGKDISAHYYSIPLEEFAIEYIPVSSLLQFKPVHSIVYPASIVSVFCRIFGLPFSTRYLAVVQAIGILFGFYILLKSLYTWLRGKTIYVGFLACLVLFGGDYVVPLNSLYPQAMFSVSFFLFVAFTARAFALIDENQPLGIRTIAPVFVSSLLLLTSCEQAVFILLPIAAVLAIVVYQCVLHNKDLKKRLIVFAAAFGCILVYSSTSFFASSGQLFNKVYLYNSFFDGVLVNSSNPEATIQQFGLEEELAADVGKTYYEPEDSFYISPTSADAGERIFSHISYPKILGWYLTHPSSAAKAADSFIISTFRELDDYFVYSDKTAADGISVVRNDWWHSLVNLFSSKTTGFFVVICLYIAVCGWIIFIDKDKKGCVIALLLIIPLIQIVVGFISGGNTVNSVSSSVFRYCGDWLALIVMSFAAILVNGFIEFLLYPDFGTRKQVSDIYTEERYTVTLPDGVFEKMSSAASKIRSGYKALISNEKSFVRLMTFIAAAVLVYVLFIPRIGAYNNGDFGRMMKAMQLTWQPYDNLHIEEQVVEKVIENYNYIEPYDWTMIRPSKVELSQAYISAFMRILYEIAGIKFSTAIVALLYAAVLVVCFRRFMIFGYSLLGSKALAVGIGFILVFFGSYNMGWLNSFFGEGVSFVFLMAVIASSIDVIQRPKGKPGIALLLYFVSCVMFVGSKAQFVITIPVIAVWTIVLIVYHMPKGVRKKIVLAAATACYAFVLIRSGINIYSNNEKISSQDTLIQGLYNGILVVADDKEAALEELGLDTRLAADAGKNAYEDPSTYFCPPRTEMAQEMIYSKVSSVDYLIWYIKHPSKLLVMLNAAAEASHNQMPDYFLFVGDRISEGGSGKVNKLGLWKQIRPAFVPDCFAGFLIVFAAIFVYCFVCILSRKTSSCKRMYLGLFVVFMLCGIIQYPLTVIGNGFSDNIKQIYLFREVWDGTVLVLLTWAVVRLSGYIKAQKEAAVSSDGSVKTRFALIEKISKRFSKKI